MNISSSDLRPSLRRAAKRATIRHGSFVENDMKKARKITTPTETGDEIFDDFEALTEIVQRSFNEAARKAVAENDALGIPTPYSKDGKIFLRQPKKATNTPR
jgi:hypothetical protein